MKAAGGTLLVAVLAVLVVCGSGLALGADDGASIASPSQQANGQLSESPSPPAGDEIEAKRTATSETFRLPSGALETRIYESPINYRDADGEWQPIEEGLEQGEGASLDNGANRFDVSLPSRLGTDQPVRLSLGEEWITYSLLAPASEPALLEGENATSYQSAAGDASFAFAGLANGLKEDILISGPSQPSSFEFELRASAGLVPTLTDEGAIDFRDEAGETVAVLPAPVMIDSGPGSPAISHDVHYELHPQAEGGWRLAIIADRAWLEDEARAWPVELDPTLHLASPVLDCTFAGNEEAPTDSWGRCGSSGQQSLYAAFRPVGSGEWRRSLLRFDLSAIPSNAYVSAATLGLHAPSAAMNTSGVEARQATRTWTSQANFFTYNGSSPWTVHGGDYSSNGAEILTSERGGQAGWWNLSQGLGSLVQGWVSGSIPNQGVLVKLRDDKTPECGGVPCAERSLTFDSSAATEAAKRPYLDITYYPPAPTDSEVTEPSEGQQTARRLRLEATGAAGTTGVTFQFRDLNSDGSPYFQTIPATLVRDANGQQVSWPLSLQNNRTAPVYFDAAHATATLRKKGGNIEVRALFEGPAGIAGYGAPVKATVDRFVGGTRNATTALGPGSLNLITGNFNVSRTDVSIAGFGSALEFSRTLNSRDTRITGVLGQSWKPSAPVEAAGGAEWQKVTEVIANAAEHAEGIGDYALLTDLEGYEYAFEKSGEAYVSPPELSGWLLSRQDSTHLALTDSDGNRTIFEKSGSSNEYLPISVSQTGGSGNTTRMVYQLIGGSRRLSMVIAPTPVGLSCPESSATTTLGCRVLAFTYQPATAWGAPAELGDRLSKVTYYGPASATAMSSWDVAQYAYNTQGRLTQEWDPRISPALKESYAYETGGQIRTITPPGEQAWTLEYGNYDEEEANSGRLAAIKRPSLLANPTVAQTTIVYGVPISGGGAPYDMSGAAVGQWGQTDIPTDATAVFPPDQVPASPPSSYSRASLYYMDAEGQLINTATPSGAGTSAPSITTSEPDEHGNVVRALSAQNRLRALAAGANSVARSHELEIKRTFSADGAEMQEEWGPLHQVRLESGSVVQARLHRVVKYDEGAPTPPPGTPMPHLPTRETVGASIGQPSDVDQRVTETKYNWTLRQPIDTIVDPGTDTLNLRTHVEYDATSGLQTERRLPANPNGGDAHTTKTIYYTVGANPIDSSCANKPAWANLPCKTMPAAQPGTAGQPELLVTKYLAYNQLGQPTEITQSPGGGTSGIRKTIVTYDAAGRPTGTNQEGGGTAMPGTLTIYNSSTGRPEIQRFQQSCGGTDGCQPPDTQALTTTYDTLGRVISYGDADGNTSTTSYDLLSRPVLTSDGKGTQTRNYDPTSGLLVGLQDSAAGTFTASYDADGNLLERGLPNSLTAQTTYDETGSPVHLRYQKTSGCSIGCTWLDFAVEESIHGQWLTQTSTLSSQQYSYDKAGRLTLVKDTPQSAGCTTRTYSYDADSNRTKLIARAPGIGGACDTTSTGTVQSYSYDAGDRLIGSSITYDNFGRITSLPGSYAGGSTLSTTYYSNDLVATQSQGGITNSYQLDGMMRQRQRTQTGGSNPGTEIYHYANSSDAPAWIDRGSAGWSRTITGIDGGLAAIQDSASGATLQLANLHGDIVATASLNPEATKPLATFEFDEFGNPKQSSGSKYGWLGGKQRRTELPSSVIQMGMRSYVPAIGRFTAVDPVLGGSANAYDYGMADPVNQLDLDGLRTRKREPESRYADPARASVAPIVCKTHLDRPHESAHVPGRVNAVASIRCVGGPVTGNIRTKLYRDGKKVGDSGLVSFGFMGEGKGRAMAAANIDCKSGRYTAVAEVFRRYPPNYYPPTQSSRLVSRRIYISC